MHCCCLEYYWLIFTKSSLKFFTQSRLTGNVALFGAVWYFHAVFYLNLGWYDWWETHQYADKGGIYHSIHSSTSVNYMDISQNSQKPVCTVCSARTGMFTVNVDSLHLRGHSVTMVTAVPFCDKSQMLWVPVFLCEWECVNKRPQSCTAKKEKLTGLINPSDSYNSKYSDLP